MSTPTPNRGPRNGVGRRAVVIERDANAPVVTGDWNTIVNVTGGLVQVGSPAWEGLIASYVDEVRAKFDYWRDRYVSLSARARAVPPKSAPRSRRTVPSYFRPIGVTVRVPQNRSETTTAPPEQRFDDVRAAVAAVGDAVLLGNPGGGKSTSVWRLVLDAAGRRRTPEAKIPILVPLGGYATSVGILAHVRRQLAQAVIEDDDGIDRALPAHRALSRVLDAGLAAGQFVLFFDGLNEMPRDDQASATAQLVKFREENGLNGFVFTCREMEYTVPLPVPQITILPLDSDEIAAFVRVYLGKSGAKLVSALRESESLTTLCRTPYLLRMVCAIYERDRELPTGIAALYAAFVGALLVREYWAQPDRWRVSVVGLPSAAQVTAAVGPYWSPYEGWNSNAAGHDLAGLSQAELERVVATGGVFVLALGRLAFAMSQTGTRGTTVPEVFVRRELEEGVAVREVTVPVDADALLALGRNTGLLDAGPDGFRFTHQLLQEYFAAVYLAVLNEATGALPDFLFEDAAWSEVLTILTGLIDDPSLMLQQLVEAGECENWRFFQRARCLIEANREVDFRLVQSTATYLYEIAAFGITNLAGGKVERAASREVEAEYARLLAEVAHDNEQDEGIEDPDWTPQDEELEDDGPDPTEPITDDESVLVALEHITELGRRYPRLETVKVVREVFREHYYRVVQLTAATSLVEDIWEVLFELAPQIARTDARLIVNDSLDGRLRAVMLARLHSWCGEYVGADLVRLIQNCYQDEVEDIFESCHELIDRPTLSAIIRLYNDKHFSSHVAERLRDAFDAHGLGFDNGFEYDVVADQFVSVRRGSRGVKRQRPDNAG